MSIETFHDHRPKVTLPKIVLGTVLEGGSFKHAVALTDPSSLHSQSESFPDEAREFAQKFQQFYGSITLFNDDVPDDIDRDNLDRIFAGKREHLEQFADTVSHLRNLQYRQNLVSSFSCIYDEAETRMNEIFKLAESVATSRGHSQNDGDLPAPEGQQNDIIMSLETLADILNSAVDRYGMSEDDTTELNRYYAQNAQGANSRDLHTYFTALEQLNKNQKSVWDNTTDPMTFTDIATSFRKVRKLQNDFESDTPGCIPAVWRDKIHNCAQSTLDCAERSVREWFASEDKKTSGNHVGGLQKKDTPPQSERMREVQMTQVTFFDIFNPVLDRYRWNKKKLSAFHDALQPLEENVRNSFVASMERVGREQKAIFKSLPVIFSLQEVERIFEEMYKMIEAFLSDLDESIPEWIVDGLRKKDMGILNDGKELISKWFRDQESLLTSSMEDISERQKPRTMPLNIFQQILNENSPEKYGLNEQRLDELQLLQGGDVILEGFSAFQREIEKNFDSLPQIITTWETFYTFLSRFHTSFERRVSSVLHNVSPLIRTSITNGYNAALAGLERDVRDQYDLDGAPTDAIQPDKEKPLEKIGNPDATIAAGHIAECVLQTARLPKFVTGFGRVGDRLPAHLKKKRDECFNEIDVKLMGLIDKLPRNLALHDAIQFLNAFCRIHNSFLTDLRSSTSQSAESYLSLTLEYQNAIKQSVLQLYATDDSLSCDWNEDPQTGDILDVSFVKRGEREMQGVVQEAVSEDDTFEGNSTDADSTNLTIVVDPWMESSLLKKRKPKKSSHKRKTITYPLTRTDHVTLEDRWKDMEEREIAHHCKLIRNVIYTRIPNFLFSCSSLAIHFQDDDERENATTAVRKYVSQIIDHLSNTIRAVVCSPIALPASLTVLSEQLSEAILSFDTDTHDIPAPVLSLLREHIDTWMFNSFPNQGEFFESYSDIDLRCSPEYSIQRLPIKTHNEALSEEEKIDKAIDVVSNTFLFALVERMSIDAKRQQITLDDQRIVNQVRSRDFSITWISVMRIAIGKALDRYLGANIRGEDQVEQYIYRIFAPARIRLVYMRVCSMVEESLKSLPEGPPSSLITAMRGKTPALSLEGFFHAPEVSDDVFQNLVIDNVLGGRDNVGLFEDEQQDIEQFCINTLTADQDIVTQLDMLNENVKKLARELDSSYHADVSIRRTDDNEAFKNGLLSIGARVLLRLGTTLDEHREKLRALSEYDLPEHVAALARQVRENGKWIDSFPDARSGEDSLILFIRSWHEHADAFIEHWSIHGEDSGSFEQARIDTDCVGYSRDSGIVQIVEGKLSSSGRKRKSVLKVDRRKVTQLLTWRNKEEQLFIRSGDSNLEGVHGDVRHSLSALWNVGSEMQNLQIELGDAKDLTLEIETASAHISSHTETLKKVTDDLASLTELIADVKILEKDVSLLVTPLYSRLEGLRTVVEREMNSVSEELMDAKNAVSRARSNLTTYSKEKGHDATRLQTLSDALEDAHKNHESVQDRSLSLSCLPIEFDTLHTVLHETITRIVGEENAMQLRSSCEGSTDGLSNDIEILADCCSTVSHDITMFCQHCNSYLDLKLEHEQLTHIQSSHTAELEALKESLLKLQSDGKQSKKLLIRMATLQDFHDRIAATVNTFLNDVE